MSSPGPAPLVAPHPLPPNLMSNSGALLACPLPIGRTAMPPKITESDQPLLRSEDEPLSPAPVSAHGARGFYLALRPGITWRHMCSFFYASLITIAAVVFMNAVQPFVFRHIGLQTNATHVSLGDNTGGALLSWTLLSQEATVILSASLWGLASDRIGRRPVYVAGLALLAVGTLCLAWVSSLASLLAVRVVFALGSAASLSMLTALLADYPAESARGKSGGVIGLTAGLGALLALFVFAQMPTTLAKANVDANTGALVMYATVAAILALSAGGVAWGLAPHSTVTVTAHASMLSIVKEGLLAARRPRILLAYMAGFASRGDAVAITSFLSLWLSDFGTAQGLTPQQALAHAGVVAGIAQTMAIVGAPFIGILADKLDRALCLTLSATWAMLSYLLLFSLTTPSGWLVYVAAICVGFGEIFMIVSSQVLIASETPVQVRGSVGGCFGLLGSASILVTSYIGGYLYDNWRPAAPFGLLALCNALVVLVGLIVLLDGWRQGRFTWRAPNNDEEPTEKHSVQNI